MRRLFFVPEPSAGGDPARTAGLADRSLSGCRTGRGGQATSGPAGYRGLSARTWMKGSPGAGGGRQRLVSLLRQWLPCGHQVG